MKQKAVKAWAVWNGEKVCQDKAHFHIYDSYGTADHVKNLAEQINGKGYLVIQVEIRPLTKKPRSK